MEEGNIIAIRCADHYERHGELKSTNICVHGAGINQCGKLACYKVSQIAKFYFLKATKIFFNFFTQGLNESCGEKLATGRCASNLMCCNGVCIGKQINF